jgi:hypothetical protein
MAIDVRKMPDVMLHALVAANNQRLVDGISTFFHLDRTAATTAADYQSQSITRVTVSAATATDSTTAIVMANAVKVAVNLHFVDAIAHNTAVSSAVATATATDTTTAITLANAIKTAFGVHLWESGVHYPNDSTNTVSAANATDATTLITLVNELKTDLNAHMASAPAGMYMNLIPA